MICRMMKGALAGALYLLASAALGWAQDLSVRDYPSKPVRIVVPYAAGGGTDALARFLSHGLEKRLGQPFIIENRPGQGTATGAAYVARVAPDGYTLLAATSSTLAFNPTVYRKLPYDPLTDFSLISLIAAVPFVLVVNPSLPVKSVKELIAHSKTKPMNYGSSGVGTTVHLGMERMAALTGARFVHVPYKGTAPALIAVMGGEIEMVPASAISASAAMKTGKVRGIGVMGLRRLPSLPDLPTVAEQGLPGFKIVNSYYAFAPGGTPRAIVMAINRVVTEGMHSPQMAQKLLAEGSQPGERLTPDELKVQIAKEYVEVEKQVKTLNIKLF